MKNVEEHMTMEVLTNKEKQQAVIIRKAICAHINLHEFSIVKTWELCRLIEKFKH